MEATKKYMVKEGATITQAGVWIRPGYYAELTDEQYELYKDLLETAESASAIEAERAQMARAAMEAKMRAAAEIERAAMEAKMRAAAEIANQPVARVVAAHVPTEAGTTKG